MTMMNAPMPLTDAPERAETWRKSIPAQVFLNHYFAIDYHIRQRNDLFDLADFPLFDGFRPLVSAEARQQLEKLLLNAWSAEYALRITPIINDTTAESNQYLQSSLHWTFPQAYYSVLFSARAFLAVQGALVSNEDIIRKRIGNAVVRGFYPASVGYYALGPINKYRISRLPKASTKADLLLPSQADQAQANIGQFLKTTRDQRLRALRNTIQNNPKTALRSERTGEILQKLSTDQYRKLAKQIGYTTYFDMLSRLRIAATNPSAAPREIERFVDADVDVRLFHQSLVNIVAHLNAVHECYVAKALGLDAYKALIARQPTYLQDSFVRDRLQTIVKPMLSAETREPMAIAASWRLAA